MLRALIGIGLAGYPLVIYFLLDSVQPVVFITIFAALVALRLFTFKPLKKRHLGLLLTGLIGFCAFAALDPQLRVLKLYPVLINLSAAGFAVYTLFYPPSAIERLSTTLGMVVEGPAVPYTRRLTMVWVGFFIANGVAAGYTAIAASTATWALYNGLLSYVFIGLLIGLEYPVRLRYRKRHESPAP